jgi:hypothetical protein
MLRRVVAEIAEGLRHGYFEYTLSCDMTGHGRRRLVLRAGKHYQFVLPAEDCESAARSVRDLRQEGASTSPS